jgi:23S rRNA (pseudouridine1915-N3)-methyltransferase
MRGPLPLEVQEFKTSHAMHLKFLGPTVLLDERGQQLTSKELAAWIKTYRDAGTQRLIFAIGDAHGFTDEERARASKVMALSRLTLPHRLARILMVEQLYRASTIIEGHPYHHD